MTTAGKLIDDVKAKFAENPAIEREVWAAWNRVCDKIHAHASATRPKMKVFEVHHLTETARARMLQAFADGKSPSGIDAIALDAIGLA